MRQEYNLTFAFEMAELLAPHGPDSWHIRWWRTSLKHGEAL